jgi:hypothetical protein
METMTQALDRLSAEGYRDQCKAEAGGVRFVGSREFYSPDELIVDEVVRFEGASSADDEAILFALHNRRDFQRATYCSSYGSGVDAVDSRTMLDLHLRDQETPDA